MNKELLLSIDNITTEENVALVDVSDAILNYYDKQRVILENCDEYESYLFPDESLIQESANEEFGRKPKQSKAVTILTKIWNTIKQFFKMIADSIRRLIEKITGAGETVVGNKKIISCDSIVLKLLSKSKYNVPDDTTQWPIPTVDSKYATSQNIEDVIDDKHNAADDVVTESFIDSRYIVVNIPAGPGSVFFPKQVRVPNNDIISVVNNEEKTITFHQAGYGKWDKTEGSADDSGYSTDVEGTKKPWTHSSRTALYLIRDSKALDKLSILTDYAIDILFKADKKRHIKFNNSCKSIIDDINRAEKKAKLKKVTVSLKDLTDFQKKINELIYKIDKFSDIRTDVSSLDKHTMESFNNLYKKLLDVQVSMNIVSSSFNTSLIINARYIGSIKNMALLDEFVNTMIDEGVPPKYVAYNTWLAANECIRGKGEDYAPCWGQTRFTFFPPNKNLVYKIAMSGAGITSNRAEIRTSEMFQKMGRVDLIAPVVKHWNNDAIVVMERIHSSGTPSYATCLAYTKRCNDAIMEYEKTHKVKLNIRIADQHKDNVMYDKKNKCYRSIDYGIATRAYVKEPKKDKKKK
jgi:soluble cytochrome b562